MLYKKSQTITKAKYFVNGSAQVNINNICLGQSQKKINVNKGQKLIMDEARHELFPKTTCNTNSQFVRHSAM